MTKSKGHKEHLGHLGHLGHLAPSRRSVIKGAGALVAGVAAPAFLRVRSAYAAYPDRPVKIVVANTPGGPSDIVGRITAAALQQATGKTFIIENIGGAGGNIGFGNAARAEADGYTILLATNAWSINVSLYNKSPYDPKDFVGVSELATSPNTFVVKSDLPAKTMQEFVALARANPDKFNLRNAADRHHTADPARSSEDPRKAAQARERRLQRWRRRYSGTPERNRAIELRLAAAGRAAHQGRDNALPCRHRRRALA